METEKKLLKAMGVISLATLASRILGFVRDIVIASMFGTGMAADAFFVAFRIPNLFRRVAGEGSLNASFIPIFTEYLNKRSKKDAWSLASNTLCVATVFLFILCVLGIIFSPALTRMTASGFSKFPAKEQLTILLTRVTFPYLFFICLVAFAMGILNSLHHFAAPAAAPIMLNLSIIGAAYFIAPRLDQPVVALAIGVTLGGLLELLLQLPFLKREKMEFTPHIDFQDDGLRRIGRLMLPAVIGGSAYEINNLIDMLMASYLPEGSVSYLYYGNRLVQFPLGIFGTALGTALLPMLSHHAAREEFDRLKDTFSFSLRNVLYVCIPAMVGLIVMSEPIVRLLFERGHFDRQATIGTTDALIFYSLGLWAYAGVRIVIAVFHSLQDTVTPVKISICAMGINVILNWILMRYLLHAGLALATSISSILNIIVLTAILRKRLGKIGGKKIFNSLLRTSLASVLMGAACWISLHYANLSAWRSKPMQMGFLCLVIIAATTFYIYLTHLFACEEFQYFSKLIRDRAKR
ncbi:MAG: murein biosynthesis integral membrane protein MurJ [Candidatus Schekmanbacteria bacterium]|nr:murein biosynthesis integral membrane protein MurJ [Candidatus Schekmanbacteria bacterium]